MRLWSVWSDYIASGEGRRKMAMIFYAENEVEALLRFAEHFGSHYEATAEPGVHDPLDLFTGSTLALCKATPALSMAVDVAYDFGGKYG